MRDLYVGGRYQRGTFIRTIEKISGDDVYYRDKVGPGVCTKKVFIKKCESFAAGDQPPRPLREEKMALTAKGNLAKLASSLAVMESQHTKIACAIQPVLGRLESAIREKVVDDLLQNLSDITLLRNKAEAAINATQFRPQRKIMLEVLLAADSALFRLELRQMEVAQTVTPFFGRLGQNERLEAIQVLADHAALTDHLRNELKNILLG